MDLSLYEKMIGSTSVADAFKRDTEFYINDIFDKSPSYKKVTIDGDTSECLIERKEDETMTIYLKPRSVLNKGSYVEIDSDCYMVTEFVANDMYPKAKIELCNSTLKWNDSTGLKQYACIVGGETYEGKYITPTDIKSKVMITSDSKLTVLVQYNEDTKTITPAQRFIFGNYVYDVEIIDSLSMVYKDNGVLKLGVKFVSATETDDTTTGVADNSGNSGWEEW